MNILITSGSIVETIDNVYYIGQRSDESIAAIIGEEFSKQTFINNVFFVYGEKSRYPWESSSSNDQKFFLDEWIDRVGLFPVNSMSHLTETLQKILSENKIDVVIHLMSVPNYGKTAVHLLKHSEDATKFIEHIANEFDLNVSVSSKESSQLTPTPSTFGKMKTGYKRVFLEQQPQEKVLSFIQHTSPTSKLISSKFEFDVTEIDLIFLAKKSLDKNNSHMVLASDIEAYNNGDDEGYFLIDENTKSPKRYGADDLANRLVDMFTP